MAQEEPRTIDGEGLKNLEERLVLADGLKEKS